MAIYSLNHKAIGKSTQNKPFTAAAHIRYITRSKACREVLGENMPTNPQKAQKWFYEEEQADRKNARMCDKVMVALPRELNGEQRHSLVKEFAETVTGGKTPWLAAIHDKGKDHNNHHSHIVFRDRDPETGKRVLHMSAGKKERSELGKVGIYPMHTERIRIIWEKTANRHLEQAGFKEKINRRTLEAQGVKREPTVHEGAQAHKLAKEGKRPESKVVEFPNAATAKSKERLVDYTKIDNGRTRQEYNRLIRQGNTSLIKELGKEVALGDDGVDGNRKSPEIIRESPKGYSRSASGYSRLGGTNKNHTEDERNTSRCQRTERQTNILLFNKRGKYDYFSPKIARSSRKTSQKRSIYRKPAIERFEHRRDRTRNGDLQQEFLGFAPKENNLSDTDRIAFQLRHAEDDQERLNILKGYHKDVQRTRLENNRDSKSEKHLSETTQELVAACNTVQKFVESRLQESETGKNYLYGKEAYEVREVLYQEDAEARKKVANAKKASEIEERLEKNPPLQAAEVNTTDISQTEGERKASELMAFLAAKSTAKPKIKSHQAAELEDEKKKQKGKNPGDDFGMG